MANLQKMAAEDIFSYTEFKSKISNEIKKIRVDALDQLEKHVNSNLSKLYSTKSENYLNLLIKLFKDDAEVCREKSVRLVNQYLSEQTIVDDETSTVVLLVVHDRIGKENYEETSEEIRYLHSKLLISLILKSDLSSGCVTNIIDVLINCLNDSYSEVKKTGFELAEIVSEKFPICFPEYSEKISKCLLKCAKHKHFRIRAGAINCLGKILIHCDKETIRLVCGSLGECLLDVNVHVRIAVLRASSFWLQELPNKYSYACYILPLILSCLQDESDECRREAIDLWSKIGLIYLKDYEDKLKDRTDYLPKDVFNSDYNITIPNYGCRALVTDQIARFLPAVIVELDDWVLEILRSSTSKRTLKIHFVPFLDVLIPALLKKCTGEEISVSKNIIETAEYIGKIVSPKIYWKLMDAHLNIGCTLNRLIILASLLKFSKEYEVREIIRDIALIFVQQQIFDMHKSSVQQRVLEITSKLLYCCGDSKLDCSVAFNINVILLTAMSEADEETQLKILELIQELCKVSEFKSLFQMNGYSLTKLYDQFLETCPLWQLHSSDLKLFELTLSRFSDSVFENVPDKFLQINEIILQPSFDKEVSFKVLLNVGKLIESERINLNKNINLIERFILGPLRPQLIWRSGKVVEVIRNAALIIFNIYSERAIPANLTLLYEFIPLVISLSEDNYEETRIAALYAFVAISRILQRGSSSLSFFIKMLTAAIQRLEDSSNRVRFTASTKIAELLAFAPKIEKNDVTEDISASFKSFELLFLMSSDENTQIRQGIRDALKQPSTWNFLKKMYSQKSLNVLIGKCRDEELISILKTSLTI